MRRNLMSIIMHPLDNLRVVIDIPHILSIKEERRWGSVLAKELEEIGSVLERPVIEGKGYRTGGRASIDDGTDGDSSLGCGARRGLRGNGCRCCGGNRGSEESVGVGREIAKGNHFEGL